MDGAGPIRVLIAADDARVRSALRTFLGAHPRLEVVAEASGPVAALSLAREHAPAVALVDVHLPGKEAGLALLRALSGRLGIAVVAIGVEASARQSALDAGASRFLDQAKVPDQLLDALVRSADRDG
ncbi:MAG TPA: response regulator [Amycolatopsis sp.]|nr:response regulator [Amycolatopsis sp.]